MRYFLNLDAILTAFYGFCAVHSEETMPQEPPAVSLHIQLTQLYQRARRAIDEAHHLTADRDFILWWYGMRPRSEKPPSAMLDE